MAADALKQVILSTDYMERNVLVFTEYHVEFDDERGTYKFFVPGGNMLSDKFKPESYYEYVLSTNVIDYEDEPVEEERYKFVINKQGKHDGRAANIFKDAKDGMIPNNMSMVIDKIKQYKKWS